MVKVYCYAIMLIICLSLKLNAMEADGSITQNSCNQSGSLIQTAAGSLEHKQNDDSYNEGSDTSEDEEPDPALPSSQQEPENPEETIRIDPIVTTNSLLYYFKQRPAVVKRAALCGSSAVIGAIAALYCIRNERSIISPSAFCATTCAFTTISSGYMLAKEIRK